MDLKKYCKEVEREMKIKNKITGKSITEGTKSDGSAWKRCSFEIDGKKLATFDTKIIDEFSPGAAVEVDYDVNETDGKKYNNISSMKKIEDSEIQSTSAPPNFFGGKGLSPEDQRRIVRQSSLKSAINFLNILIETEPEVIKTAVKEHDTAKLITSTAEIFENWIYREDSE